MEAAATISVMTTGATAQIITLSTTKASDARYKRQRNGGTLFSEKTGDNVTIM